MYKDVNGNSKAKPNPNTIKKFDMQKELMKLKTYSQKSYLKKLNSKS